MTTVKKPSPRQRFVVPRENRATLIVPPLEEAGTLAEENVRRRNAPAGDLQGAIASAGCTLQGRSLAELSRLARVELLAAALKWTSAYRTVEMPSVDPAGLLFLAGHQPELFHPGVWFKNFALGELAQRYGAAAVNLVIDSDALKSTALSVPCGTPDDPHRDSVLFDRPDARIPFEERPVLDAACFCNFGRRVAKRLASLVPDPLVNRYWPLVEERAQRINRLGYCLAQARHQLEGQWGLQTLEAPQSAVCDCEPFYWFLAHLIAHSERFRDCYNQAVQEYRRANHIRSAGHPVPDLAAEGAWLEVPLWIWTAEQPLRRRMFVCRRGDEYIVSDRGKQEIHLLMKGDDDVTDAVKRLREWGRQGVKIRSRALVTTLWARLALGDLFLHGIGGAKYDQVTDRLIKTFFGLEPPAIMVLSATLYLPVPRPASPEAELRALRRQLRDMSYHPETYLRETGALDRDPTAAALAAEKQRWIDTPAMDHDGYARWKALSRINHDLQPWVAARQQQLLDQQAQTQRALRCDRVLGSREYGFCLFPESYLKEFLGALLPKSK